MKKGYRGFCVNVYVVANMEAPVTAGDIKSERKLNHVNSPEVVPYLLKLNARIWSLANNHVMDCQEQGLRDTLEISTKNGIRTMGAGLTERRGENPLYCNIHTLL